MATLLLTQNKKALVDEEDYGYLSQWKWSYHPEGYAKRTLDTHRSSSRRTTTTRFLHQEVFKSPSQRIDHINGNKLDNRKCNLRGATVAQNAMNKKKCSKYSSKYKGVHWCKKAKKWIAQIKLQGKSTHLGSSCREEEAANIYNIAAIKHFGEFAKLNKGAE